MSGPHLDEVWRQVVNCITSNKGFNVVNCDLRMLLIIQQVVELCKENIDTLFVDFQAEFNIFYEKAEVLSGFISLLTH